MILNEKNNSLSLLEERLLSAESDIGTLKSNSDIRIGHELSVSDKSEELERVVKGMKEFFDIDLFAITDMRKEIAELSN